MGLKTGIWVSRPKFRLRDWDLRGGTKKYEKEKEEKIPHMCESIGYRPLRGRCPKGEKKDKNNLMSEIKRIL